MSTLTKVLPARIALACAMLFLSGAALAGAMEERVRSVLAPPASIAEHSEDLHLSAKQRDAVMKLGNQYQARVQRLQADMLDATERLVEALEQQPIDEATALAQLAQLSAKEAEVKRLHLELWIQCNAQLRPLQRKQAVALANEDTKRGRKPDFAGRKPDAIDFTQGASRGTTRSASSASRWCCGRTSRCRPGACAPLICAIRCSMASARSWSCCRSWSSSTSRRPCSRERGS